MTVEPRISLDHCAEDGKHERPEGRRIDGTLAVRRRKADVVLSSMLEAREPQLVGSCSRDPKELSK